MFTDVLPSLAPFQSCKCLNILVTLPLVGWFRLWQIDVAIVSANLLVRQDPRFSQSVHRCNSQDISKVHQHHSESSDANTLLLLLHFRLKMSYIALHNASFLIWDEATLLPVAGKMCLVCAKLMWTEMLQTRH